MDLSYCIKNISPDFVELYKSIDPELLKLEGIAAQNLDVFAMSEKYFDINLIDSSIDDNANAHESKSYGNYILEISKGWLKLLGYYKLYERLKAEHSVEHAQKLMRSVLDGDLYFHDSTSIEIPYCWAFSTSFILQKGSDWGQLKSLAAKCRRSFLDQVREVTIELAQEFAGAIAIGDLFVNYSYFVKKEGLDLQYSKDRKIVENDFQSFVHTLNKKLRPSHQSPFSNISIFDRPNLEYLFDDLRFPDGSKPDFDLVEEIQKIFCDWFKKGDPSTGLPYRFPVVTLNLRIDENREILDKAAFDYFSNINLEKGCFNIYISSGNKIASCCRLVNDFDLAGCDSFGNGGVSLGSHRVVTVNLARLGRKAKSIDDLIAQLKDQLTRTTDLLVAHRNLLKERVDNGLLNFFERGLVHFDRLFSTIGMNGLYECLEELGVSIVSKKGQELASYILEEIRLFAQEASKKNGVSFNVEQVPAESLAVKFAAKDKYLYDMDYDMYSNQFIPLWEDCDIVDRIAIDGKLSRSLTGGGIVHLNVGEKLTNVNQMKKLIDYAIKSGSEHFAVNYNFGVCANEHVTVSGPTKNCSICSAPIKNNYTRIVGYFTPVSSWNKGRRAEHKIRVFKKEGQIEGSLLFNKENAGVSAQKS